MAVLYKNNRIASYIRTGLTRMEESRDDWFHYGEHAVMGCALGLAIAGKLGTIAGHSEYMDGLIRNKGDEIATISEILEIEPRLASEINQLHMMEVPATEIAECLEYEEGDDQLDRFAVIT